jgi:hypothetical protein
MKTKTKSKILFGLAAIFCCVISLSSFGQNSIIPQFQDFHGTWQGLNASGQQVEMTLTSDWKCTFNVNNAPIHADNQIKAYRMPQFFPKNLAANGPPTSPEITVKFYTQNALAGIRLATNSTNSVGNNSVTVNSTEQIYTGLAVLSTNASGQLEMALYINAADYSDVPPSLPDANAVPYCVLVKQ